jgi:cell division septum initiation protein DivIVA
VALDRQSIEKKDFPVGQHGYDPAAVDAHLADVANELEEFKQASRRRGETLASAAGDQVRAIVQAAESSAAEIQRTAEEEAHEIRSEADREAHAIRQRATDEARESFGRVAESTQSMLQRLDAMESELTALIESLRTGSDRLNADLQALEGHVHDVGDTLQRPPRFDPEPPAPPESDPAYEPPPAEPAESAGSGASEGAEPTYDPDQPTYDPGEPTYAPPEPAVAPSGESTYEPPMYEPPGISEPLAPPGGEEAPANGFGGDFGSPSEAEQGGGGSEGPFVGSPAPEISPVAESSGGSSEDMEGARLIALNMALNGTPREETDRYLGENFHLPDRQDLLDEVYSSVED